MRATLSHNRFDNRRATTTTRTFFAVEGAETILESTARAVHAFVHHIDACPADGNRAREYLANCTIQTSAFRTCQRFRAAQWMQFGVPQ